MLPIIIMAFRRQSFWLTTLAVIGFPMASSACEPILPLTKLMSGATLVGPLYLLQSVMWLSIAVTIKSVSFVLLERRLPPFQAIAFMLAANVLSTIPGLLTAVFAGAFALLAVPIIFALGKLAEKRFSTLPKQARSRWFPQNAVAPLLTAAFIVSVVMFYVAGATLDDGNFAGYWVLKLLFATIAVSVGMGISTVLEECVVARLARKGHGQLSFFTSVVRANYITLGLVLFVAAAQILPKRLSAPHFIVSWFHNIAFTLGLA